jgi:hypothetical protein
VLERSPGDHDDTGSIRNVQTATVRGGPVNEVGRHAVRYALVAAVVGVLVGTALNGSVAVGLAWGVGSGTGVLLGLLGYDACRRRGD